MKRVVLVGLLWPLTGYAQTLTVPCMQNNTDGRVLFHNEVLPVLPKQQRWTLIRYEPTGSGTAVWQDGQCTVQVEQRR